MSVIAIKRGRAGFSIIELMISMVIGLVIIAGVAQIYVSTAVSSSQSLKAAKLNQELRAAMDIMEADIRRTGMDGLASPTKIDLWKLTVDPTNGRPNPFMQASSDINIVGGNCILFSYDRDLDGTLSNTEYFGYRLNNGAIEARTQGSDTTACSGTWQPLTDSDVVTVTALSFTTEGGKCLDFTTNPQRTWTMPLGATTAPCASSAPGYNAAATGDSLVETRQVVINIQGQIVGDANTTKNVTAAVRLRNDRALTAP